QSPFDNRFVERSSHENWRACGTHRSSRAASPLFDRRGLHSGAARRSRQRRLRRRAPGCAISASRRQPSSCCSRPARARRFRWPPASRSSSTWMCSAAAIPYRSVDLDSAAYQKDNWGGQIRSVLKARTKSPTIPQIFVANQYIGGCTETFDAFNDGRLQKLMRDNGIAFKQAENVDAYSFLPKWLHPR